MELLSVDYPISNISVYYNMREWRNWQHAADLKSAGSDTVRVRVPSPAPLSLVYITIIACNIDSCIDKLYDPITQGLKGYAPFNIVLRLFLLPVRRYARIADILYRDVTQMVGCLVRDQDAAGWSPVISTMGDLISQLNM